MEKKTKYLIITLCCIFGLVLGSTVAWYTWTSSTNTDVTFTIGGITINYVAGDNITGQNLRPTVSKEIGVTNNYAIKKDITVSATKTAYLNLYLTAETLPDILSHESVKWEVYEGDTLLNYGDFGTVTEGDIIKILSKTEINSTTKNISLYIWIDGNMENPSSMGGQTYSFVLSADATDEPNYALTTLTNLGLTDYLNIGTPNFANIATEDEGIYATEDDLGTSYYFRGASEHNYVKFEPLADEVVSYWRGYLGYETSSQEDCEETVPEYEDAYCMLLDEGTYILVHSEKDYGTQEECESNAYECIKQTKTIEDMYFRIIRINGDGTIRMIYEGNSVHRNGVNSDAYIISTIPGTRGNGTAFQRVIDMVTEQFDSFYGVIPTGYKEYIVDGLYCDEISSWTHTDYSGVITLPGWCGEDYICHAQWEYPVVDRIYAGNYNPSLKCNSSNEYIVGTIMGDEVALAGGVNELVNKNYYLYTGYNYLTTSNVGGDEATDYFASVTDEGTLYLAQNEYIRPVINLKADTEFTGTGTYNDPFVVTLN